MLMFVVKSTPFLFDSPWKNSITGGKIAATTKNTTQIFKLVFFFSHINYVEGR